MYSLICGVYNANQFRLTLSSMALANELANFNIVVEKWDSSKRGGFKGK
jgi:hypothetical protein